MHRGCTSILRNGILKQYPPVLLRLCPSNVFGIDVNTNKRLWHDNCDSYKQPNVSNNLTVQNEEELHRACVQMINQCQVMVRKLQLHANRPNSKSARRRQNPRNLNSKQNTDQSICFSVQPPRYAALVAKEQQLPPATTGESTDSTCHCCPSATNKHDKMKEDNGDIAVASPSLGPKLLQTYTVAPPTKPVVKQQLTNRRGTTRKRVLQTCPHSTHAPPTVACGWNQQQSCKTLRDMKSSSCVVGSSDAQESKVSCALLQQPPLQLSVTPLQSRLRAEARAKVELHTTMPLVRSKAERAVDIICKSTIKMMEQLSRLPRILQTPIPIQCQQPPTSNKSAKNSLPNLPFLQSAKKHPKKTYTQAKTETFLHSPCETPLAHPPPKLLNDCSSSKRLYSRTNVGQPRLQKMIVAPTPTSTKNKISCCRVVRSNQQVRQIMTSASSGAASGGGNENTPPKSNDSNAEATCSGNVQKNKQLKPECKTKTERHVCRPETSSEPCAMKKDAGPCRDELNLATTATKPATVGQEKLHKDSENQSCEGAPPKKVKQKKVNVHSKPHKPPGSCQCPPPLETCSAACQGNENLCSAPERSTSRLRRPPIPKHLLKRQSICFEACMAKPHETRRKIGNCDKMLQNSNNKEERPPDPMKRPADPCASVNKCKQSDCPVLHMFAPPPKTDADLPPSVLPFPKDMCGQQDPDAVPPWETKGRNGPDEKEIKCNLRGSIIVNPSGKKNTCGPVQPKVKPPPPICAFKDDECFICQSEADMLHPAYPDPICPPVLTSGIRPQRVKYMDVLRQVPCAKRSLTCEEQLQVDEYCDPCYKAKELHQYSGTAYYDMHNFMAGRRRRIPGPNNYRRRRSWKEEEPC